MPSNIEVVVVKEHNKCASLYRSRSLKEDLPLEEHKELLALAFVETTALDRPWSSETFTFNLHWYFWSLSQIPYRSFTSRSQLSFFSGLVIKFSALSVSHYHFIAYPSNSSGFYKTYNVFTFGELKVNSFYIGGLIACTH